MKNNRWRRKPWFFAFFVAAMAAAMAWGVPRTAAVPIQALCGGETLDWRGARAATVLDLAVARGDAYHLLATEDYFAVTRLQLLRRRCDLVYRDLAGDTRPLSAALPPAIAAQFERAIVARAIEEVGGREAYQKQLQAGATRDHPLPVAPETIAAFQDLGIRLPAHYVVVFEASIDAS